MFTSSNAPAQGCGLFDAGSTVTTVAAIAAWQPVTRSRAADAVTGDTNDCATGSVSASNPNYTPVD